MATTTVYATTNTTGRGTIKVSNTDWDDAINATSGTVETVSSNQFAVRAGALTGRGGTQYRVARTFAFFSLSSITTTITAATVKVHGSGTNSGGTMGMYASTAFGNNGSTLASTDFDNGTSTAYSATVYNELNWDTGDLNDFTVNATGISAMNTNNYLNVVFRNTFDVDEETPEDDSYLGINFFTSGTDRIQVVVTHADPGYGNNVNAVASANISKVNTVGTANISKINAAS
tara:strand:- start:415 stop:1110 length:696 start_codon:yes stop_codon:yes gene_type:complete